jgi:PAS domain S-box-containing protein
MAKGACVEKNTRNTESQRLQGLIHAVLSFGLKPGQEHRFREYQLARDKTGVRAGVYIVITALIAFLYNDHLFFGFSPLFFGFLASRIYILAFSAWFLHYSRKSTDFASYDRAEFIWALNVAVFALLTSLSRPPTFISHAVVVIASIFITIFIIPSNYRFQLIVMVIYATGESAIIIRNRHALDAQLFFSTITSIILSTAVAAYCSWLINFAKRREFLANENAVKIEDRLGISEEKYRDLVDYAPAGIYEIDVRGEKFLNVNEYMCELLGYSRQELLSMSPSGLMDRESRELFAERVAKNLVGGKTDEAVEYNIRRKDGSLINAVINVKTIFYSDGKPSSVMVVGYDVTSDRQAEKQKNFYAMIMRTMYDSIIATDADLKITAWNYGSEQLYGWTEKEALGKNAPQLLRSEHDPEARNDVVAELDRGGNPARELIHHRKDSERIIVESRSNAIFDRQGKAAGYVFANHDITARKRVERELRESEEKFKSIAEAMAVGIGVVAREDGRFLYVNNAYQKAFGYSGEELLDRTAPDIYGDQRDRAGMLELMEKNKQVDDYEVMLKRKDGSTFWSRSSIRPIEFSGNQALIGSFVDITRRKKIEEELRESESNLKILTESILDVFTAIDRDMKFTFWNKAAEELTGLRAEDVVGKKWLDVMGDRDASKTTYRHMRMCLETGQPIQYENMTEYDGEKHFFEVSLFPTDGGATIISRDVTRKKATEAALMESELKFSAMFNSAPVGMSLSAVEGREIFNVNQAWLDMTGYTQKEQVAGKTFEELGLNFGAGKMEPFPEGSGQSGRARGMETTFCTKNGVQRNILVNVDTIELDGRKFLLSTNEDITERKFAEKILKRDKESTERLVEERTRELIAAQKELERANRLMDIGSLAATVAHELRNPLAAIHLMTYNIKRKVEKPELAPYLYSIDQKIKESEQIINNLLFYTRLKPPHREGFNLFDLIEETAGYFEEMGGNKVIITKNTEPIRSAVIEADQGQVKEVLTNLLINAFDAVPSGKGKVTIKAQSDGDFISITVSDNGGGIDAGIMDRIFDPFFTTKTKGTGLGLSVCRQIVNNHGGKIDIESSPDKGATVMVALPVKAGQKI